MATGFILVGSTEGVEKELGSTKQLLESLGVQISVVNYHDVAVLAADDAGGVCYVKGERRSLPDFVLVVALGERDDYDFRATLRMFETRGVVVVNTADAVDKAGDKLYSFLFAKQAVPEIKIPKTLLVTSTTTPDDVERLIGLPVVLKVMNGVQGKGVELVRTKDELRAMLSMLTAAPFGDHIIAQQAIMSSAGKDIRVVVAGGEVLHSFVRSNDGEFKSNLHQGGHIETFEPPADLVDMSIRLADALGLKLGSIDYLFGENEGEFWLCEVNSTPGIAYLFAAQETGDTALLKKFMAMPGRLLAREGVKI
ncbi:MAG: hypothetical protein WAY93_05385 [Atopobiaceae bacterium]|jgi:RimK family alpha-L-glutamate ligase